MKHIRENLKRGVSALAKPEGRRVGSPGHAHARAWLLEKVRLAGLAPYRGDGFELSYTEGGERFTNIVGVIRGRHPTLEPILIGAHYDSVIDAPCADDNAAAVVIALEVAEALLGGNLERDVVIAFFDAEEPPYFQSPMMGSIRFYEDQMDERGLHAALVMDLVGHDVVLPVGQALRSLRVMPSMIKGLGLKLPRLRNLLFITGAESHPEMVDLLQGASIDDLPIVATLNEYIGDLSDHGVFRSNGIPYLFLSCGRWKHYHEPTDTPERLNYMKMARITNLVVYLTERLNASPFGRGEKAGDFTVSLEIELLERAFGPLYPLLLRGAGVARLEERADVDQVASAFLSVGL